MGKDMDVDNREIEREGRKVQEGIKIWVLSGSQHTSRLLQQPHWLLIPSRVRYKYNCLTILHFFCQNFETLSFLSSVLYPHHQSRRLFLEEALTLIDTEEGFEEKGGSGSSSSRREPT